MKVMVTGGAGFIGSHIVDIFIKNGYEVVVVDDLSHGKFSNVNKSAKFIKMDIKNKSLYKIFEKEKINYVSHHAAQISVYSSVKDPVNDANINIIGSLNLLECCHRYKVKKIIFASSGGTLYGEVKSKPATEKNRLDPCSPYGIAKLAVEKYMEFYFREYGLNYVSLRYSNVYGPRQDPFGEAGVVAIFTEAMLNWKTPVINGDGKYIRDYVYCKDVANANLLAVKKNITGCFNVGTGKDMDVNVLFDKLSRLLDFKKIPEHGKARAGDLRKSILSYKLFKSKTGWNPSVTLDEGLRSTVEFFKSKKLF